jgi:hypothetical protein
MRNDALPALIATAVIAGVICLLIGVGAAWLFLMPGAAPGPVPHAAPTARAEADGPRSARSDSSQTTDPARQTPLQDQLRAQTERADRLSDEQARLRAERDALARDNARLLERVAELEKRAPDAPKPPTTPGGLPVTFGTWGELAELRGADWAELGDALKQMVPLIEPVARDLREGRQPDSDTGAKLQAHNKKLIKLAVALHGKVPSHTGNFNGEYTHPVSIVNLLASQLAAAGKPLTDAQKQRLAELGDEYDKRWAAQNAAYGPETLLLQKILDEAELKQWFTDQMWQVTTAEQKAVAVNPLVEGYLSFDLYSPALMFQGVARPLQAVAREDLKGHLKTWLASNFGVTRESLDGAEFAFDDWLASLNLEPRSATEASFIHFRELVAAGRAHLALLQTLLTTALNDPEVAKKVRQEGAFVLPQVLRQ